MINDKQLLIINDIVQQIFESPFETSIKPYAKHIPYLQNVYFILLHPKGINYTIKFKRLNLTDIDILHFFESETLYCLNQESLMAEL